MLLGAHLIFGNALVLGGVEGIISPLVQQPAGAFLLGVASHHLGDLLPHIDSNLWPRDFDHLRDWPPTLWALTIGELILGALVLLHFGSVWRGREAIVLAVNFGAVLPDLLSHTPIKYLLARIRLGRAYIGGHKHFHFRPYSEGRYQKLALAFVVEAVILLLSLVALGSFS